MKPVIGDPKKIVRRGYDECGPRYLDERGNGPPDVLRRLIKLLPENASVLDVGCGAGHPVSTTLAAHAIVTGVDISEAQAQAARAVLPDTATVIQGDITALEFPPESFDAIVSFYTLFHVPREEHHGLLRNIARWLRPGGHTLLTTARTNHPGYTEDFLGVTMYWSHFGPDWYLGVLQELGFEVIHDGALPPGTGDAYDHPTLLARLERPAAGDF